MTPIIREADHCGSDQEPRTPWMCFLFIAMYDYEALVYVF